MRYIVVFAAGLLFSQISNGQELISIVEKYVSLGEHRTGTSTDRATSEWLGQELKSYGYNVKYLEFPTRQFFPENVYLSAKNDSINAFPLWFVNENVPKTISGKLVDPKTIKSFNKNDIALIEWPDPKRSYGNNAAYIDSLVDKGISGLVIITNNPSGEIQAYNTTENAKPWRVPIILVAPKDSTKVRGLLQKNVTLAINGTFKNVSGRNVYGTIGNGEKYIVVSTPISGWFTCGGERGSGIAIWLSLAKYIAQHPSTYTFIFTGNSGHENAFYGAHHFLESEAPAREKTHLWLHLGAGAATLKYTISTTGLVKENKVDEKRRFFYSKGVKQSFTSAFKNVEGEKVLANENPGGELAYVARKGYTRFAGITHVHPFFHVKTDDASTTSEEILQSTATAFKNFLAAEAGLNNDSIIFKRFDKNPIITADMLPGEKGENINGPSLLKTPDWLKNKLGKYYLYFAHHKGKYIRLAYANDLKGPWKIYEPGTLQLNDCRCKDGPAKSAASVRHNGAENAEDQVTHVASPDVHIDEQNKQLVMYFHCPLTQRGKNGQYSLRAVSKDGIHFKADTTILGVSYFRVFQWKDNYYALARNSKFSKSKDGIQEFIEGPNVFNKIQNPSTLRHAAVKLVNDILYVFYSRVGDSPERILLSKIKLTDNWNDWTPTAPVTVAEPETDYEGADLPVKASEMGLYYGKVRQLRDPYIYEEDGKWYLLYTAGGENAIGIGQILSPFAK